MRRLLTAAALAGALASPATAQETPIACDDAGMMKAEQHANTMKGEAMAAAKKEIDMARAAMKDGNVETCDTHLEKAMEVMDAD